MFTILISILLLFNLSVLSYTGNEDYILENDYKYAYLFVIGFINNLTYYEHSFFEIYGYNFTCKNVIVVSLSNVEGLTVDRINNNENYSVTHIYFENFAESDYKGLITNNFICCIQSHKWDFD